MENFSAFRTLDGDFGKGLILLADHATNALPRRYAKLGLPAEAFLRHIAYDIGIGPLVTQVSAMLGVPAVMSGFSRLLIDPNRAEDDPTLIMKISDGAIIDGNHPLSQAEIDLRIRCFYRPYHQAVDSMIKKATKVSGSAPLVISLHSYTPFWKTIARPWHAGVLWDNDPRAALALIDELEKCPEILVGNNEPYDGCLQGDTMYKHCMVSGIAHALLEIRQDLIKDEQGVASWAHRLCPILARLNGDPLNHQIKVHKSRSGAY